MSKDLVTQFFETTRDYDPYVITGNFAPLFTFIPWVFDGKRNFLPALSIIEDGKVTNYFDNQAYRAAATEALSQIYRQKKEPADFRAVYADLYPAIADLYRKEVLRNTALFSNEQLISSTLAYYKILLSVTFHLWYTVILEEQMVKDIFSAEDYNKVLQIWEKASHPYFESFLFRRKRRLIETLREEKDMQLAAKKLRYLFMDYSEQKSDEEVEDFLLGVDRKKEGQEAV